MSSYRTAYPWWQIAAIVIGLCAVLVGTADITSRLAKNFIGDDFSSTAFAPVGAFGDDALLASLRGNTTPKTETTTDSGVRGTALGAITPVRLQVPSIGIDAKVQQVGKKDDGSMGTPTNFDDVGWYMLGSRPGEAGSAVFDGHVNNARTAAGVFQNLSKIKLGDYITVSDESGRTVVYKVRQTDLYDTDNAPLASIFATTGPSQIVLITCDGDWNTTARTYNKRFVVIARQVN